MTTCSLSRVFQNLLAAAMLAGVVGTVWAQTGPNLADISLPPGFSIEIWADEVPNARSMALGDNGTVFVATRRDGRIFAVSPSDAGRPVVTTLEEGLRMPNGVATREGDLFVAENHRIIRFDDIEANLESMPEPVVVIVTLLRERHHRWR
ncbi:MAG: PQQ-binding-like beta-propeller repeat protein [Pseudomonadota bacterium]|nr:PQQ-binding-like beta-propeller repeat protein [Pseudomonadota bacterium]